MVSPSATSRKHKRDGDKGNRENSLGGRSVRIEHTISVGECLSKIRNQNLIAQVARQLWMGNVHVVDSDGSSESCECVA